MTRPSKLAHPVNEAWDRAIAKAAYAELKFGIGSARKRWPRHVPLETRLARLFKPYFVRRAKGNCQVLFALTELDGLVDAIISECSKDMEP